MARASASAKPISRLTDVDLDTLRRHLAALRRFNEWEEKIPIRES